MQGYQGHPIQLLRAVGTPIWSRESERIDTSLPWQSHQVAEGSVKGIFDCPILVHSYPNSSPRWHHGGHPVWWPLESPYSSPYTPQCSPSLPTSTWHGEGGIHTDKDVWRCGFAPSSGSCCIDLSSLQFPQGIAAIFPKDIASYKHDHHVVLGTSTAFLVCCVSCASCPELHSYCCCKIEGLNKVAKLCRCWCRQGKKFPWTNPDVKMKTLDSPGRFAKPLLQTEVGLVGSTLSSLWKEVHPWSNSCWSFWKYAVFSTLRYMFEEGLKICTFYPQGHSSPHWQTQWAEQLRERTPLMREAARLQNLEETTVLHF